MALRRPAPAYAFAIGLALLAAAIRFWLDGSLPPGFPFLTFFPAVIITAFVAGTGPAVLSAVLCGGIAWWAFISPEPGWALTPGSALALGFYAVIVSVDIVIIHIAFVMQSRLHATEAEARGLAETRALLFSELQHRVSNNLQLVSTLLTLERAALRDPKAVAALRDAAERLALIARIQRRFHDPGAGPVALSAFLRGLAEDTLRASGAEEVVLSVDADHLTLTADKAIPVALIVTELVSNALEHGFGPGGRGRIEIIGRPAAGGQVHLSVADDGAGPGDGFSPAAMTSLGLQIVAALARQIGGAFTLTREAGRTFGRVAFPA